MTVVQDEHGATPIAVVDTAPASEAESGGVVLVGFAVTLAGWSVAYMVLHVHWALGGTIGLSTLKPSAPALPEWRAINWAATGVLTLPVLIAIALVHARPGPLKAGLLITSLAGAAIAVGHGLYGFAYRSLTVLGSVDIDGGSFDASRHGWVVWDLLVFEPWFLIEGLLFIGVGWAASRPTSRRRWIIACAVAVTLSTISGLVGLRV